MMVCFFLLTDLAYSQISLVKDLEGTSSGHPCNGFAERAIVFDNELYFTTFNSSNEQVLYKTDGTEANSLPLRYYSTNNLCTADQNPNWKIRDNAGTPQLGFFATDQNSQPGFHNFCTLNPLNTQVNYITNRTLPIGLEIPDGRFYFVSTNGVVDVITRYNNSGTIATIRTFDNGISKIFSYNSKLIIAGDNDTGIGYELYEYDSSTNTSSLIADINASGSSYPQNFIEANGKLYFTANDGAERLLHVYDGTSVTKISSTPTVFSDAITKLTINSKTYLIYKSSANSTNTLLSIDTDNDTFESLSTSIQNPTEMFEYNGFIYFGALGNNGIELYKTQGTSITTALVADINPNGNSAPKNFIEYQNELYFNAYHPTYGFELWKLDSNDSVALVNEGELLVWLKQVLKTEKVSIKRN